MNRGRRRRSAGEMASVSLFPFLAVLICTMGALIVLLVVNVQQAGNATTGASEPIVSIVEPIVLESEEVDPLQLEEAANELAELQRSKEDLAWRAEGLVASRETTLQTLKDQQLHLSMVEDQSFELQNQLTRLRDEVVALKSATIDQQQASSNDARLAELQAEIEQAKKDVAAAEQEAQDRKGRFTIIPHPGENGTNRRPIYVECLPDKVILQPEGIVLQMSDFQAPMGPENQLASALRAKREFLLNAGVIKTSADPYPLLIVRPGAEIAYAACLSALTGWDEDFGYELVPANMELAYPPVNQLLVGFMEQIIAQVRARRALLVSNEKPSTGVVMGISHEQGGFVQTGDGGTAVAGATAAGTATDRQVRPATPLADAPSSAQQTGGSNAADNPADANAYEPGQGGEFPATPSESEDAATADNVQVGNYEFKEGDQSDEGTNPGKSQVAFAGGTSESGSADGNGGVQSTSYSESQGAGDGGAAQMSFSMAKTQGQNWALPNDTSGAIGVVRPVYLTCTANEIILHPESRANQHQHQIPFVASTTSAVQPFVGALWERMAAWGTAGNGMYWQPLLKCEIAPGGEERFHELTALLHGSGLEIKRR